MSVKYDYIANILRIDDNPSGGGGGGGLSLVGISATYAGLPDATTNSGKLAFLSADDGINQSGFYLSDGVSWLFSNIDITAVSKTVDPTVADDGTAGYFIGQIWINTTTDDLFVSTDISTGAAIWKKINLTTDQVSALDNANSPSAINPYATLLDILPTTGDNRVISGSASYSGVGFTYDVSALTYIIQGTIYNSVATQVTLAAPDPVLDRIDVIYADDTNSVGVITGTPAATPAKPSVDNLTQVEVTFITVPGGATTPVVNIESIYDEFAGTVGGEWDTTTTTTATLNAITDPYSGTTHIELSSSFGSNKNIIFTPSTAYTFNGGQLSFWMKPKTDMTISSGQVKVGFFVGGSLVGSALTIGGSPLLTFGFDGSNTGTYQLVTIPLVAFGSLPASVDDFRFFTLGGPNSAQFDLDVVKIEEGVPTPPPAVINSSDVVVPNDGITTHLINMEQTINHLWSASSLEGFDLTDNLDGTVDITAGDALLRSADNHGSQLKSYRVPATAGVTLSDNDQNFIYIEYNGGAPQISVTTDPTTLDGRTETPIYLVTRVGNTLHYVDIRFYTVDYIHEQTRKEFFTQGYVHEPGGSLIADEGNFEFSLTPGAFYLTDRRIPHIGFDTTVGGGDTFTRYYTSDSGATWTRTTGQTAINNTQWNDVTSGLVALSNNKYKVAWVYLVLNDVDFLAVVEGQAEYANVADANAAPRPSILPPEVQQYSTGILVGKVIIQEITGGSTSFIDVQTPFGEFLLGTAPSLSVTSLSNLTDTDITSPQTNDIIKYNSISGNWENVAISQNIAAGTLSSWTLDAGDIYYADLVHNLGSDDVLVEIYDSVTKETVLVDKIDRIDVNTVRVYIQGNTASLRVLVTNALPIYQGSSGRNIVSNPTGPYTAQNNDIIIWDVSAGSDVVNLPPVATSNNFRIDIKKTDVSANTITVEPNASELIEGASNAVITLQYEAISIVCDGGQWWIVAAV